jgi:hypothetical protein
MNCKCIICVSSDRLCFDDELALTYIMPASMRFDDHFLKVIKNSRNIFRSIIIDKMRISKA